MLDALSNNRSSRAARHAEADDTGAVLVTVVVVMLVGFVIAAIIAASTLFTISANVDNKDRTEAFIAAESGRDVAVKRLVGFAGGTACNAGSLAGTSTGVPAYDFDIYTTTDTTPSDAADPLSLDGLTKACPTAATARVVVAATGTMNAGATDETTSHIATVYSWDKVPKEQPGGTVAYFDGKFKATKSTYAGDLVIRENDYECNSGSNIVGDLWVLGGATGTVGGNVTISTGCNVTGSIYARGTVHTKGGGGQGGISIGGDIVTEKGDIDLDPDSITLGGSLYSGRNVLLKKSGTAKDIRAVGTISLGGWTATGVQQAGAPAPVFDPTLNRVYIITNWVDLGSSNWDQQPAEKLDACTLSTADRRNPVNYLTGSTTRLVIDYTGCNTTVDLGPGTITRDVVLVFPAAANMDVSAAGSLTSASSNQVMFVHVDKTMSNNVPDCGNKNKKGENVEDSFDVAGGTYSVRIMVYSPCGIGGNLNADFTGQLYTNADDTRSVHSLFTCKPMSWVPVLNNLSCTVKGEGGAAGGTVYTQALGGRSFQTELGAEYTP